MAHHSTQVSSDLIWEIAHVGVGDTARRRNYVRGLKFGIIGNQNSYLVKRAQSGGVRFSRDPLNLTNVHSRKNAGFVNDKAVGVVPAKDGGVSLITKKVKHPQRPASHSHTTTLSGKKSTRKTYKTIASNTAKSGYRPDLRASAIARASAIRKSQKEPKDLPESKLRGAKAKKAAAEKEE
ncbi:putative 60S ribosomal protein L28e [Lachnellula arida]|uniref:Putative 60S ribosomal protein L28e n=1 Tax=Lachnellula arida TaxID=1316785 RepID=A0A8T9B4N5_9HELO|nr:putative 60S ribosomal protein L28e [Lachnellula arida]